MMMMMMLGVLSDARAASAERVFFDGFYLGQWCEAVHVLTHTEPHQTQLDLKQKCPEQVLLGSLRACVSLPAGVLLWVCICVCVCVCVCIYNNKKTDFVSAKDSCFSEKQAWIRALWRCSVLSLSALMTMRQIFSSYLCRQPILESHRGAQSVCCIVSVCFQRGLCY